MVFTSFSLSTSLLALLLLRVFCVHGSCRIRLVDGEAPFEGRVEVFQSREWGTVCDNGWDVNDALVVCRELGLPTTFPAVRNEFGKGNGSIFLNKLQCNGTENSLFECAHNTTTNCEHVQDAGVRCLKERECSDATVRLVGGSSSIIGRVEVCSNGIWGTVCDDKWTRNNTLVVCRQLGLPTESARVAHPFHGGTGPILLDNVNCRGNESSLFQCSYTGNHNCRHIEDVAIQCGVLCNDSDIRLMDSPFPNAGRLESCSDGVWNTVCDDRWNRKNAEVVCRQLGMPTENPQVIEEFGLGVGPIITKTFVCSGTENKLSECDRGFIFSCGHNEDVGIRCYSEFDCPNVNLLHGSCTCQDGDVRLMDGSSPNEGRVEYCSGGVWGTVCDDDWDRKDASVVCRQLGLPTNYTDSIRHFGGGTGYVVLDDVQCLGSEASLSECPHITEGNHDCRQLENIGIKCQHVPVCNDTDVRLVDGSTPNEGRVEYCSGGEWGTVCYHNWDRNDALVVCRQLGMATKNPLSITNVPGGYGYILLDEVQCRGNESNLSECSHAGIKNNNCIHRDDIRVKCVPVCNTTDIRLVDRSSSSKGRVEYCHDGEWKTVCVDCWDRSNAIVVCRQLGLPTESVLFTQEKLSSSALSLSAVRCVGNESRLSECSYPGFYNETCSNAQDINIVCACRDGDVRLVNGSNPNEGRVEYCSNGLWGTVCDDGWDSNDAAVVCRQLGLPTEYVYIEYFGGGSGPIVLIEVACTGSEINLSQCPQNKVGHRNCLHTEDIGIQCQKEPRKPLCFDGEVRLTNRVLSFIGIVELCRNEKWEHICANGWDNNDANVVCKQLGFPPSGTTAAQTYVDLNSNEVVGEVSCNGSEESLTDCTNSILQCPNTVAVASCSGISIRCAEKKSPPPISTEDIKRYGSCEPYSGGVEICNDIHSAGVDYVFVSKSMGSQEYIAQILRSNIRQSLLADSNCRRLLFLIVCNYYLPSCGTKGLIVPPSSICPEECYMVMDECETEWDAVQLGLQHQRFINCSDTSSLLYPLPNCCTGVGIKRRAGEKESGKSVAVPAIGGTIFALLLLLAVVIFLVVLIFHYIRLRKKKRRLESWQLDIMAIPSSHASPLASNTAKGAELETSFGAEYELQTANHDHDNIYKSDPVISTPETERSRVLCENPKYESSSRVKQMSSYLRELTKEMIIPCNQLNLLEIIGQGEFGIVYRATLSMWTDKTTQSTVAVKTLKGYFDDREIDKIMEESLKMKNFQHQNVMGLIGLCLDAGPVPYIVMPYMANGSLLHFLKKERKNLVLSTDADEEQIEEVSKRLTVMCTQIADGMAYLAEQKFIHRDLAARNCMLDGHFVIKISDFGLSEDVYARNYFRQSSSNEIVKLPVKWMALESLTDGIFSEKSDVWSYGVTMWEIFSGGKMPYPGVDPLNLILLLEDGQRMNKPTNVACIDEIFQLMVKCWESDPEKRPSFNYLLRSTSSYVLKIAGYLEMNFAPAHMISAATNEDDVKDKKDAVQEKGKERKE